VAIEGATAQIGKSNLAVPTKVNAAAVTAVEWLPHRVRAPYSQASLTQHSLNRSSTHPIFARKRSTVAFSRYVEPKPMHLSTNQPH
jgi:hypothetical protein